MDSPATPAFTLSLAFAAALIASMLVVLWTGRKPTKRTFELICFYFAGWVGDEELLAHLAAGGNLPRVKSAVATALP